MTVAVGRKFRDSVKSAVGADAVEGYVKAVQESMWPGGVRRPASAARSNEQKDRTKANAAQKLQMLMPGGFIFRVSLSSRSKLFN